MSSYDRRGAGTRVGMMGSNHANKVCRLVFVRGWSLHPPMIFLLPLTQNLRKGIWLPFPMGLTFLLTVCSANVDIATGNLFWLACDRSVIQRTRIPGPDTRMLYRAGSIILHLLLDWPKRVLYWVESGKPLQSMTLDGKNRQEVWRGTWTADTHMALDLGSSSILWTTKGLGKHHTASAVRRSLRGWERVLLLV